MCSKENSVGTAIEVRQAAKLNSTLLLAFVWPLLPGCGTPPKPIAPVASENSMLVAGERSPEQTQPEWRGPVVVAIVIDQLAAWEFAERHEKLPPDGGFARLLREGLYVKQARYSYASTFTAPGHATLYTGCTPRESGAMYNEVFDDSTGEKRPLVSDASTKLVTSEGQQDESSASLSALTTDTVADRMRAKNPNAVILSLSLKDRGAVFSGGRHPTASLWYDGEVWVTSTAFSERLPSWVAEADEQLEGFSEKPWSLLDPAWTAKMARTKDDAPGEANYLGLGTRFPHDPKASSDPGAVLKVTPQGNEALIGLALRALAAEAMDPSRPLFLAVSLSGLDYAGHVFGPDSWEWWDMFLNLDQLILRFMEALDHTFGKTGYSLLLSGDHGVSVVPESIPTDAEPGDDRVPWCASSEPDPWQRPCERGRRVNVQALLPKLERSATAALGKGEWIRGFVEPRLVLSETAAKADPAKVANLEKVLSGELLKEPGVARVIPTRTLPDPCPDASDESLEALVCRSVKQGDHALYVVPSPGSFFRLSFTNGRGAHHGTPYLYDRAVPLLVRTASGYGAKTVIEKPTDASSFTATLSSLLGVEPPCRYDSAADYSGSSGH